MSGTIALPKGESHRRAAGQSSPAPATSPPVPPMTAPEPVTAASTEFERMVRSNEFVGYLLGHGGRWPGWTSRGHRNSRPASLHDRPLAGPVDD